MLDFAEVFGCYVRQHISGVRVIHVIFVVLTSSRRKTKRSAMCFVFNEYVALSPRCSAPVLSQLTGTELNVLNPTSITRLENYATSFDP